MTGTPTRPVVAIDGPAGAGKSTVARLVAEALGLEVLDTGAMYRAVTLAVLESGTDPADGRRVGGIAAAVTIEVDGRTRLDGRDVSDAIRTPEVTAAVSAVSAHPAVRTTLIDRQRAWVDAHGGGVAEGRDMGRVVFPDARLKVFLTASEDERARRRHRDEGAADRDVGFDAARRTLLERDAADHETNPLVAEVDAIIVDSTGRTLDDVVAEIADAYRSRDDG